MINFYDEVERLVLSLDHTDPESEDYKRITSRIKDIIELEILLLKANASTKEPSKIEKILNNGPLLNGAFGLLGIFVMMNHERLHIITSRALSHIRFR